MLNVISGWIVAVSLRPNEIVNSIFSIMGRCVNMLTLPYRACVKGIIIFLSTIFCFIILRM